jgi:hypothetical protein
VVRRSSSQQQEGRSSGSSSVGGCFFTLALPQAPSESPHKKLVKYFVFLEKKKKKKILRFLCVCVCVCVFVFLWLLFLWVLGCEVFCLTMTAAAAAASGTMSSVVSVSSSLLPDLPLLQTSCSSFSGSWKELSMARQLHPVVNKNRKSSSVVKFSSIPRAAAAASSTSAAMNQAAVGAAADAAAAAAKKNNKNKEQGVDTLVKQIHTVEEFDAAMRAAKSKLVVVEYAASHSEKSKKIYPAMVDLSIACQDVVFLLILGDETDDTKELCARAGIEKVGNAEFSPVLSCSLLSIISSLLLISSSVSVSVSLSEISVSLCLSLSLSLCLTPKLCFFFF